jgi:predicted ribosomally synthesized peptide with nif11-like leader
MSTENLSKFTEAAKTDTELQAQISAIRTAGGEVAEKLSALSVKIGIPCTPEDFRAEDRPLTEEELDGVAGGTPTGWDTGGPRQRY